jgi:hypothetical protein
MPHKGIRTGGDIRLVSICFMNDWIIEKISVHAGDGTDLEWVREVMEAESFPLLNPSGLKKGCYPQRSWVPYRWHRKPTCRDGDYHDAGDRWQSVQDPRARAYRLPIRPVR